MMPIKKRAMAFLTATVVVLMCHRAVALPPSVLTPLAGIPSLVLRSTSLSSVQCSGVATELAALQAQLVIDAAAANGYFVSVAQIYNEWYTQLAPKENHDVDFPVGYFSPIVQSAQNLNVSANVLDSVSDGYQNAVSRVKAKIRKCFQPDPTEQNILSELDHFDETLNDNQSAIDAFTGQLQSNLSDDASNWQQFEGHLMQILNGTFQPLQGDAGAYVQGADFIRQNGQIIAKKLDPIIKALADLRAKP